MLKFFTLRATMLAKFSKGPTAAQKTSKQGTGAWGNAHDKKYLFTNVILWKTVIRHKHNKKARKRIFPFRASGLPLVNVRY